MGRQVEKEAELRNGSFLARSIHSLRGAVAAIGGAAVVSTLAEAGTVAQELTKAERRRRQRERDDEDDDRKRNDRDDDDDGNDLLSGLRARHADLRDRMSSPTRRETSQQSADEDNTDGRRSGGADAEDDGNGSTGGGRNRRDDESTDIDPDRDSTETIRTTQTVEVDSPEPASSGALRVGSGDTFASVDPETGTAIAESNGVRAIAGPDGAFIEGTPGSSSPPTGGTGGDPGRPGGGGDDAGGDNGDDFAS